MQDAISILITLLVLKLTLSTTTYLNTQKSFIYMPESKKIVLDTNFLLIPGQIGLDIFAEIERIADFKYGLFILDRSLGELQNVLEKQKGRHKSAAKIAFSLIKSKNFNILPSPQGIKHVDDALVELVKKDKSIIIATVDAELRQRIKKEGAKVITSRQKSHLIIEG